MGVEQGGPSEEDLKIRPGEPIRREPNLEAARFDANNIEEVLEHRDGELKEARERVEILKDQLADAERIVAGLESENENRRNQFAR